MRFRVWCPEDGEIEEDGVIFDQSSAFDSACFYARWDDRESAEYRVAKGDEITVLVKDLQTGEISKWRVTGETVPSYWAEQIGEDDE